MKKNLTKPHLFTLATIIVLLLTIGFTSCEKETLVINENQEYLEIENLNSLNYTKEEKAILLKAENRIYKNLIIKKSKMSLEHTSAKELNMDEDLFNFFKILVINSKKIPKISSKKIVRLRGKGIEQLEGDCDRGFVGDVIYNSLDSDIEKDFFDNYWCGDGDMLLTEEQWEGISSHAVNKVGNNYLSGTPVIINGVTYYKVSVSFYDNNEYDYALGSATVYFDDNGKAVGMHDEYDFNAQEWGERSTEAEIATRTIKTIGQMHGAQDFNIDYGIHE